MIFMHALFNLPIQNLMRHTCYIGGDLAFPLTCCTHANNLYQSSKRTIVKNSKTTQQRISCLLEDIDLLTTFEDNHFLQVLLQNIEAKKWSAVVVKPVAVLTATVHQRKRPSRTQMLKMIWMMITKMLVLMIHFKTMILLFLHLLFLWHSANQ
jgi:hypothetical protein